MKTLQDYQTIIEECNEECLRCRADYAKEGLIFAASACRYCSNGSKLHETYLKVSEAEKKWGAQDWNSSRLKKYYLG